MIDPRDDSVVTPVIEVRNLCKTYDGQQILRGVDFQVGRGEVKAVLGPSGSGKSTMLRLMALLEPADSGDVLFDGDVLGVHRVRGRMRRLKESELARQRRQIGMVFQRFNLFPHLRAVDNVAAALTTVAGERRGPAEQKAREMLDRVGLSNRADAFPAELSGGQQQRVAIARALVLNPQVMLFDEPTSALDPELVGEVLEVMEALAADGMTMVVVTHEVNFARRVASEVAMFDGGVIIEAAPPAQFFGDPQQERTRRFLSHVE